MLIAIAAAKETNAAPPSVQQDTSVVTLRLTNEPLDRAFREIKRQTPYRVLYANGLIDQAKKVTISLEKVSITVALKELLKGQLFTYTIDGKNIIIVPKKPAVSNGGPDILSTPSPDIELAPITGLITDSLGNPLAGASITIQGKGTTTVSDAAGKFTIETRVGDVLVISFVGYENQSITVKDNQSLSIRLIRKLSGLDEITVVSTGYQDIPKERATGSFVQIDNELISRSVSENIMDRIKYVANGLNFEPKMGGHITRSDINIRGISTINANMKPLVVVDNVPYDGDINLLNPNDVESVTILKDAAAASIWGARSGNGVIVIKTKQGKYNEKTKIQLVSNVTIGEKYRFQDLPLMLAPEVIEVQKLLFSNGYYNAYDDVYPAFNLFPALPPVVELLLSARRGELEMEDAEQTIEKMKTNDVRRDIDKYLTQNSLNQQYALNVSGGSSSYRYFASIGFDKNRPEQIGDSHGRINVRLDNTFMPLKNLEINGFMVSTSSRNDNNGFNSASLLGYQAAIYSSLVDDAGAALAVPKDLRSLYVDSATYPSLLDWHYRPIDELANTNNHTNIQDTRLGSSIRYRPLHGLSAELKYQHQESVTTIRNLYNQETYFTRDLINRFMTVLGGQTGYPIPLGSIVDLDKIDFRSTNIRGQINVDQRLGSGHLVGLAGMEARQVESDRNNSRKYGFDESINTVTQAINYAVPYSYRPSGTRVIDSREGNDATIHRYISYFSNVAYSLQEKYTLSLSGRVDGSNFYGIKANQRLVPLWSAGFRWHISKENFYNIPWLYSLKIRGSYGFTGNTDNKASSYPILQYETASSSINNVATAYLQTPPNPRLIWEKVKIMNIGIDFESVNRVIGGSLEYYHKKGVDLISNLNIDATTGVTTYVGNNASIKGKGIDITLNTQNISGGRFRWSTNFLFSYNVDKVTHYDIAPTTAGDYLNSYTPIIDYPLFTLFSYRWAGLDPKTGDPQAYHADTITDFSTLYSRRTPSDLVYSGRLLPKFFGSIRNTLQYNNLSLSCNITYKLGYVFRRNSINYTTLFTSWNGHADYQSRWRKPGDEAFTNIPSMPSIADKRDDIYAFSDILVEDASHIRVQDIRIAYDLSLQRKNALAPTNCQLFLYLNNLGMLWKNNTHGIDPDYTVRPPRSASLGVNIRL